MSQQNSGAKPTVSLTSSRFYARYRPLPRRSVISPPADGPADNRTPDTPSPQVPWYNMGLSEPSTTDKFATVPKFLLAMQSITFIIRHLQILLWSKMWDLDFGGAGGPGANDPYHNMEAHPPIPPPRLHCARTPRGLGTCHVPPSAGRRILRHGGPGVAYKPPRRDRTRSDCRSRVTATRRGADAVGGAEYGEVNIWEALGADESVGESMRASPRPRCTRIW